MQRREFITLLGAAVVASSVVARAQQSTKVYRVGILGSSSATALTESLHGALFGRLRELGYAEGQNLIIERRFTEGRNERYHALATELVNLKVDLIVAPGTAAALATKEVTSIIPIGGGWRSCRLPAHRESASTRRKRHRYVVLSIRPNRQRARIAQRDDATSIARGSALQSNEHVAPSLAKGVGGNGCDATRPPSIH